MNELPEIELLRSFFRYNPITGDITLLKKRSRRCKIGQSVLTNHKTGYKIVQLGRKVFYAHRIAWKLYYGVEPEDQIDHINGIKSNNSIRNLRATDYGRNARNRVSKGYSYIPSIGKYRASVVDKGKSYDIGYYKCETAASLMYLLEKVKLGHLEASRVFAHSSEDLATT